MALVGKEGLSDALVASVKSALATHELIKVKLGESATSEERDRKEVCAELASASGGHLVGQIGRTLLLYKRNSKKPKILLPGEKAPKEKTTGPSKASRARRADRKAKVASKTPRESRSTRSTARVSRELEGKPQEHDRSDGGDNGGDGNDGGDDEN